jgi:hypothetical protein
MRRRIIVNSSINPTVPSMHIVAICDWLARVIRANPFYVTCHVSALNFARDWRLPWASRGVQDFFERDACPVPDGGSGPAEHREDEGLL